VPAQAKISFGSFRKMIFGMGTCSFTGKEAQSSLPNVYIAVAISFTPIINAFWREKKGSCKKIKINHPRFLILIFKSFILFSVLPIGFKFSVVDFFPHNFLKRNEEYFISLHTYHYLRA
jgi:hypothetical protein